MLYELSEKGTEKILQESFVVCVFSNHFKKEVIGWLDKILAVAKVQMNTKSNKKKMTFIVRDDGTIISKMLINKYKDDKTIDIVTNKIDWESGKNAGLKSMGDTIKHCNMALCLYDGKDKLENIFMSFTDPFNMIVYNMFTGQESQ